MCESPEEMGSHNESSFWVPALNDVANPVALPAAARKTPRTTNTHPRNPKAFDHRQMQPCRTGGKHDKIRNGPKGRPNQVIHLAEQQQLETKLSEPPSPKTSQAWTNSLEGPLPHPQLCGRRSGVGCRRGFLRLDLWKSSANPLLGDRGHGRPTPPWLPVLVRLNCSNSGTPSRLLAGIGFLSGRRFVPSTQLTHPMFESSKSFLKKSAAASGPLTGLAE